MAERQVLVMIGTKKGAFLATSDRCRAGWTLEGPLFGGKPVYHMNYDQRSGTLFAAMTSPFWGPSLERSSDLGRTWERSMEGLAYDEASGLAVAGVWHIEPGPENQPGVVYAGVEPAGLFKSLDGGRSWRPVDGLNKHATRDRWVPGGGGLCLHTILPDQTNPSRLYAAISAAGAFRSDDGGENWQPINQGVRADFLPDPYPEFGQCVHKVVTHAAAPETLYQQNHCGVYRSTDAGEHWQDIGEGRLPARFGFAMAIHPHDPRTLYTVPLESDELRLSPEGRMAVWRSRDGGESWQALTCGLPGPGAHLTTLREGLATDSVEDAGVYVGTTNGQVFYSRDEGRRWQTLAAYLPSVLSVEVAVV